MLKEKGIHAEGSCICCGFIRIWYFKIAGKEDGVCKVIFVSLHVYNHALSFGVMVGPMGEALSYF
jgi:hypothetical protein